MKGKFYPIRTNEKVRHKASPDFSKRVYLLGGEDEFRKRLFLERLKSRLLGEKADAFSYESYDGKTSPIDDILNSLDTLPLDGKNKLVVVNEPQLLSAEDRSRLTNYLCRPRQSKTILVLLSKGVSSQDDEFSRILSKYANVINFSKLAPDEVMVWVIKEFKDRNKTINRQAAQRLCDIVGANLGRAHFLIEQVSLFVGSREKVTDDDLVVFCEEAPANAVYELLDAINERDTKRSLSILERLLHSGNNPVKLLGLLSWHISRLIAVKKMLLNRVSKDEIASCFNMGNYALSRLISHLEDLTLAQLKKSLNALLDTDLLIKRSGIKGEFLLEMLVVRLSAP